MSVVRLLPHRKYTLVNVMFQINVDIQLKKLCYKSHGITDGQIHFIPTKISENGNVKIVTLITDSETET